ncbi:MAG: Xaa-Pro peptidase family protein [Paracoccaceae bacterium]|nr:Xaa-Pro peptidase family protein [Paracoccaceae bacterium]
MNTSTAVVESGIEATFSKEELEGRVTATRGVMAERGIDVMIVTGPENIYYLTGQQTPGYYTYQALLVPIDADPVFIVRQLELNNLVANSFVKDIHPYLDNADPVDVTSKLINDMGWQSKHIAIDERGWFLPIAIYKALLSKLGDLGNAAGVVESLRAIKSPNELEKLRISASYVHAGMRAGMDAIAVGKTENDIVSEMMGHAIKAGSEYVGMEPLMASGPRCGIPHGTWRRRVIEAGDPVFLEMAAAHDRYHASLMRSAWIGQPNDKARRMMDCVLAGLDSALDVLKPGNSCAEVHDACQATIDKYGYTENFKKRTGYSVGISFAPDWGEGNVLSLYTGIDRELEPGMAFHIPPALRIYGEFTVGVSETAIVTETGCETLLNFPRDLYIVD